MNLLLRFLYSILAIHTVTISVSFTQSKAIVVNLKRIKSCFKFKISGNSRSPIVNDRKINQANSR